MDMIPTKRKVFKVPVRALNMPVDSAHKELRPFGAILQEHGL
jgi:hypothetical protein